MGYLREDIAPVAASPLGRVRPENRRGSWIQGRMGTGTILQTRSPRGTSTMRPISRRASATQRLPAVMNYKDLAEAIAPHRRAPEAPAYRMSSSNSPIRHSRKMSHEHVGQAGVSAKIGTVRTRKSAHATRFLIDSGVL